MNNIPEVKIGIAAVSRDCFPKSLSETRRKAVFAEYKKITVKSTNVKPLLKMKKICFAHSMNLKKPDAMPL